MPEARRVGYETRAAFQAAPWNRFVAIGDSITEGYGMDDVEGIDSIPWATRVADAIRQSKPDLDFVNLARRNLGAKEILELQVERAITLEPDLVSVTAGPNDLLDPDLAHEPLLRDLDAIFSALVGTGATVFTFTYMRMPDSGLLPEDGTAWLRERMELLHDATREASARNGVLLVDLWELPETADPSFYSLDLQHANARGQRFVADYTIEFLADHLRETVADDHLVSTVAGDGLD